MEKKIVNILRKNKNMLFYNLLYSVSGSVFAIVISLLSKKVINGVSGSEIIDGKACILTYLPVSILLLVIIFYSKYNLSNITFRFMADVQMKIFSHIKDIDLNKNQDIERGGIITYISKDINVISGFIQWDLIKIFEALITFVSMSIVCVWLDWHIFAFTLCCTMMYGLVVFLANRIRACDEQLRTEEKHVTSLSLQIYRGLPVIDLFEGSYRIVRDYRRRLDTINEVALKKVKLEGLYSFLAWGSNMIRELGIIVAGPLVFKLDLGTTMALINVSSYMNSTFACLGEGLCSYQEVKVAIKHINEALAMPIEKLKKPELSDVKEIELRNISFSYANGKKAIDNLSCKIHTGEMLGLVGEIGSGKSTLIKILLGLYVPQEGQVLLNDRKIDADSVSELRQHVSYVDQGNGVFEGSIRDNLTGYGTRITDEEIWTVLEKINLKTWVEQQEHGLDTQVGQGGIELSGGEKQRLSVARALLKKSACLIIDEPTSALDKENERIIKKAIESEKGKRTIIIISHRREFISNVDRVIALNHGRIEEEWANGSRINAAGA